MILFDLETVRLDTNPEPDAGDSPRNIKDPAKIEAWRIGKVASLKSKESLCSSTGRVVLISASVDFGPVRQWYGHDEKMLLEGFSEWAKACDLMPSRDFLSGDHVVRHALVAYNGCRFDFNFMAHRASVHGLEGLAARSFCATRYGDGHHVDPWLFFDCRLGHAARSYGHHHPSPGGGAMVCDWWRARDEDRIRQHGIDDILALQAVVRGGRRFIHPKR